ncbi:uncharacterized protein [Nicotiana tomentosiformis]|uniref:uncharacterized protein n=1 Tax=Nicotiana tomentosiformis TaxID=4098 RepID=UPI00388C4B1A
MRFSELARHTVWLVPTDRKRIMRFIDCLMYQVRLLMTRERVCGATFDEVVDIARKIEMVRSQERGERDTKRPRGSGGFGGVPSRGKSYPSRGHPYRPTQTTRPAHRGASASHSSYNAHSGQSSFSALPAQSSHHASSAQASTGSSSGYPEQQFHHSRGCFECGYFGYIKRDCSRFLSGAPQQSSRLIALAPAVTPPTQPARGGPQATRGRPRGGRRAGGGQARFYVIPTRPNDVASDVVITGIVSWHFWAMWYRIRGSRERQYDDPYFLVLKDTVQHGDAREVTIGNDGVLRMHGRIYVRSVDGLRELILEEAHSLRYSIHPGAGKMYQNLRQHYWWRRMKKYIVGACVIDFGGCWDLFLPLRSLPTTTATIKHSDGSERLRTVQSRQKSYADRKVRDVAYIVGEKLLLKASPMKGVMRFRKKGKLSPRYIGPFEVLQRIGEVAYKLSLPLSLSSVHPVFHVSMLRKYVGDPSHVLDFSTVQLDGDLTYDVEPVDILVKI